MSDGRQVVHLDRYTYPGALLHRLMQPSFRQACASGNAVHNRGASAATG
jgi:hypothetical protein